MAERSFAEEVKKLRLGARPKEMPLLQAAAAAGQSVLMRLYEEAFGRHELAVAQILLTHADLADRARANNARDALAALLDARVVPIINENDTVSVAEIKFGDNDHLAAMVTNLLRAPLLVLLTTPVVAQLASQSVSAVSVAALLLAVAAAIVWITRERLREHLRALWARTEHLRVDRGALGLAVFYATLAQVETNARQSVVAAAFGLPLSIQQSATITAMTIVGGFVPTIGSIGAIDGSMVAGLMLCGATAETAVAITIVGRAISYGLSTAAGALALALLGGRRVLRAVAAR